MPKPPTAERGRRTRLALPEPSPPRRTLLGRVKPSGPVAALDPPPARRNGHAGAVRQPPAALDEPEEAPEAGPGWRMAATPLICVVGLGVATYLTVVEYSAAKVALCSGTGAIDCMKVLTSSSSRLAGIPVALLGAIYFLVMLPLCLPAAWRSAHPLVAPVRLVGAIAGIGFVFYLVYAELFVVKAICLWCTSVHVLTFLLFVCVMTGWDQARAAHRAEAALSH